MYHPIVNCQIITTFSLGTPVGQRSENADK